MSELLSLITGPNGFMAGLLAVAVAVAISFFKGRSSGVSSERAKADKARAKAAEDRLEMHREATEIERSVGNANGDELDKRAKRWARD